MAKSSAKLTSSREDEIVQACAKLYGTLGYKDITIKEIASFTSFTRPSIYNYFQTKEEIFLAYLQIEYERWADDLAELCLSEEAPSRRRLAEGIARSLEKRCNMLKLLSMNIGEIEANSRMDNLIAFKRVYGRAIRAIKACTAHFCPDMSEADIDDFAFTFLPFLFGVIPYSLHSQKQLQAMDAAGAEYRLRGIYEVVYLGTMRLLGAQ